MRCRSTLAAGSEICPECRLKCSQDSFRPNYSFARLVERAFPDLYSLAKSKCLLLDWLWAKKESTGVFITVSSTEPDDVVVPILGALDKLDIWSVQPSFGRIDVLFAESVGCVMTRRPLWTSLPKGSGLVDIRWDSHALFLFKPENTGPDWLVDAPAAVVPSS